MAVHVSFCGEFQLSIFKLRDRIGYRAAGAGHDFNAGLLQHPERLGPAMAGNQRIHVMVNDGLARLNAGSLGQIEVLAVFHDFKGHGIRINDDRIGCPPESRIQIRFQLFSCGCNGYFHYFHPLRFRFSGFR